MKLKKISKFILAVTLIFVIGGAASVTVNRYIFPKLAMTRFFSQFEIFQEVNEKVNVIKKTEKIIVKEDNSINEIASQAATAVVNIVSVSEAGKQSRNGTGVIVTSDGLIVTYRDTIIENKAKYKVLIFNGSSFDADLVGVDNFSNLAFFKIATSNLPVISFANSDDSRPGRKLIAIGNSFGEYQNRFAAGLLSNVNKTFNLSGNIISSSEKLEGIFETDFNNQEAYIGGPMIDYNGEMVGIIGSVNINNKEKHFQIPANIVKRSMELAIEKKLASRPMMGIYYLPVTKVYAAANGINRDRGAIIYSPSGRQGLAVISGSPAEKSGLKVGDIIIALNAQEINLDNPLSNILSEYETGDMVELLVDRLGEEIKIDVQL